jgi:transcription antitermination factor NusG
MRAIQHPIEQSCNRQPWQGTLPCEIPNWYAVQTRPRHEKKADAKLRHKGVLTFLPLMTEIHRWSDRKTRIELPLFPGYTFVRIAWTALQRLSVLQTAGVLRLVGNGCEGVPIEEKQIDNIRSLLTARTPLLPYPFLKTGQRVRIRGGCLEGIEGILLSHSSGSRLIVSIEAIQRSLAVRLEGYRVEPV